MPLTFEEGEKPSAEVAASPSVADDPPSKDDNDVDPAPSSPTPSLPSRVDAAAASPSRGNGVTSIKKELRKKEDTPSRKRLREAVRRTVGKENILPIRRYSFS